MNATRYELPLQELFTRLREAGLPLGIDEYQLVLRSMQAGFGMSDKGALKRLCQTLWVKSAEEKRLFEYQFEQVMSSEAVLPTLKPLAHQRKISWMTRYVSLGILGVGIVLSVGLIFKQLTQTKNLNSTAPLAATAEPTPTQTPNINRNLPDWILWTLLLVMGLGAGYPIVLSVAKSIAKQRINQSTSLPKSISTTAYSVLPSKLTQTIKDEVQVAQAVLQSTSKNEEILESRFILTTEYFPVTERQMKQIWRYLRRPVREGQPTELDMEATVNQIGRQGILLAPVLVPRRVNQADLLLLIDQDGSMVPFHTLSRRLAETALRGGRLGKAGIYYFHNCPIEYLYHDPNHLQAELVSHVVTNVCSERTAVLILSDAGAARGGNSEERYKLTQEFLDKLKQQVRYIAWLNPMPKKRWNQTTAGRIARVVPMFEVSRPGLQDAIAVLCGRPILGSVN
ncbi:hypothetical protein [Brasilonema sp. UFV-L1]|uniref:hypothetical protein n=1 Tax=Brasilonema sp. UFV-L1 TaxID=2234130 RepID=UPI00145CD61B|nr:hypothetical protein [Brasilonema sp. UFV-L1]NMG07711.1 hypothetical protein [Brasilonema sp. UFV-L1]